MMQDDTNTENDNSNDNSDKFNNVQLALPQHLKWVNNQFKFDLNNMTDNLYDWMVDKIPDGRLRSEEMNNIKDCLKSIYKNIDKPENEIIDDSTKATIESLVKHIQKCKNEMIVQMKYVIKMNDDYVKALLAKINKANDQSSKSLESLTKVIEIYDNAKGSKYLFHNLVFQCWEWYLLFVSSALPVILIPFMCPPFGVHDDRLFNLRFAIFESRSLKKSMNVNLNKTDSNYGTKYKYKKARDSNFKSTLKAVMAIGAHWIKIDNKDEYNQFKLSVETCYQSVDETHEPPKKKQKLISQQKQQ